MNAQIKLLDAMMAVVSQMIRSPDSDMRLAAIDELAVMARRRAKLEREAQSADKTSPMEVAA